MVLTFIINPHAGGIFKRRSRRVLEALATSGLNYHVRTTEYPRHAVELAREAAMRSDVVVAVGGDGTVNEVVSGLVGSGGTACLAVIPVGTGNDFAKMLDVPEDPSAALKALSTGARSRVDYGLVRWEGQGESGTAIFVNAAGTGIDARVAAAAAGMRYLNGTPRYVAAVIRTLRHWNAPRVRVDVERNGRRDRVSTSEHLLVLAGNGCCAAGGFYLTPDARIDDGAIDVCIIRNAPLSRILALIPAVLRGGQHAGEPEVTLMKAERIRVESATPLAIQADGEVITSAALDITFEIVAQGLSVVQPVRR